MAEQQQFFPEPDSAAKRRADWTGLGMLDREITLATRLDQYGARDIFAGITDRRRRKIRTRVAIEQHGLANVMCEYDPKKKNFAEMFMEVYCEPLTQPNIQQPTAEGDA